MKTTQRSRAVEAAIWGMPIVSMDATLDSNGTTKSVQASAMPCSTALFISDESLPVSDVFPAPAPILPVGHFLSTEPAVITPQ